MRWWFACASSGGAGCCRVSRARSTRELARKRDDRLALPNDIACASALRVLGRSAGIVAVLQEGDAFHQRLVRQSSRPTDSSFARNRSALRRTSRGLGEHIFLDFSMHAHTPLGRIAGVTARPSVRPSGCAIPCVAVRAGAAATSAAQPRRRDRTDALYLFEALLDPCRVDVAACALQVERGRRRGFCTGPA
jgi:hypothetical protein